MAITVTHCCGLSLKTGTIVIGVLSVMAALSAMSYGIISFTTPQMTQVAAKNLNVTEEFRENYNGVLATSWYINIPVFILMSINLLCSVSLVFGAIVGKPAMVTPWSSNCSTHFIVVSILYAILMINLFIYATPGAGILLLVTLLIYVALSAYFIIVVNSFYRELINGQNDYSMI